MAIPEKLDFNSSFWKDPKWKDAKVRFLDTPLDLPRMKFHSLPHNRTNHKSPGSRTYSETVYNERFGHFMIHQGIEELRTVEFWQEVAMLTDEDATVEVMQQKMVYLTREQVYEGYVHYCDVWSWDDDSPKTRRLMEAFEAEHTNGPKVRLFEKELMYAAIEKVYKQAYSIIKPPAA